MHETISANSISFEFQQLLDQFEERARQFETINSIELAKAYYLVLQLLEAGQDIYFKTLANIQFLYPQGLLNGQPGNLETIATLLKYIGERMPLHIFKQNLSSVQISNDSTAIMNVPHTSEAMAGEAKRKRPPNRARWTIIRTTEQGKTSLTLDSRDDKPRMPTDGFEILSWLGSLEQIRLTIRELRDRGVDISIINQTMVDIHRKHISSEISMLEKKLVFQIADDIRLKITNRLNILRIRMTFINKLGDNLLNEWLSADRDEVQVRTDYPGQLILSHDHSRSPKTASNATVQMIERELKARGINNPTDILFGNDFSIRLYLSVGLFDEQEFRRLEFFFHKKLKNILPFLEKLTDQSIRDAAKKFFLVQQLSQYDGLDKEISKLRLRMYSSDTFNDLGIERLIQTYDSPIADPVDVLVPDNISPKILNNLPKAIRETLITIIENHQIILSIPYNFGYLTASMIKSLHTEFPDINGLGFIGKVGCGKTGEDANGQVGNLVLPTRSCNQFKDPVLEVQNRLTKSTIDHGQSVNDGINFSTCSLTLQESREMRALAKDLDEGEILTLDSELYYLMEWYYGLSQHEQEKIAFYLIYYISDITVFPENFDPSIHTEEKISTPLGNRGSIPLFIALTTVLSQLAKKSQPEED